MNQTTTIQSASLEYRGGITGINRRGHIIAIPDAIRDAVAHIHRPHRGGVPQPLPTKGHRLPTVMQQPIPCGGTDPLKVGDQVQIVPEWQDPGDDKFERFVIEAPPDCTSVRIRTVVPGLVFQPGEWIEAEKLVFISP